jgi:hypothetical protein
MFHPVLINVLINHVFPLSFCKRVYLLLGAEPIQQQIDKRILTLFGQNSRDPDTLEFQIAQRQISIHEINSTSWFSLVRKHLLQYDLPTALEVLTGPLTKTQWKNMIDKNINQYWAVFP